jgi:hypothetical protein
MRSRVTANDAGGHPTSGVPIFVMEESSI